MSRPVRLTSWRTALAAFGAILLPIPLVMLLGGVMQPALWRQPSKERRVSPVLGFEERLSRATYQRACQRSSDCEAPLGCFSDSRVRGRYCTDSQCMTDEDCAEGLVCRSLTTIGDGPLVRFCVAVGPRLEGERCFDLPEDKTAACGPGLLCAGREGWCARPCSTGEASCPEGFFCADVAPQPVCLPRCEAQACAEGQRCVRFEEGVAACAQVFGTDCQQSPCPANQECKVLDAPMHPGKAWMECVERCGEGLPACGEGRACDGWHCLPSCSSEVPDTCGEGYRCKQRRPDRPWVCQPDW